MEKNRSFQYHIQITARDLWGFSMYHSNKGYLGVFNVLFTLAALWLLVTRWGDFNIPYRLLLLVCVLMFTVWQPFLLYLKARKQARTAVIKEPVDMTFSEEGLAVMQGGEKKEASWEQVGSVEYMRGQLIIYMSRNRAFLLPDRVTGQEKEELCQLIRDQVPKGRRKRI
ncbi:MAG: YcxB family protein [Hungatella sp.]|jgi:hypothetical protein|nr:YcxB family protein [Hungatella sp.]